MKIEIGKLVKCWFGLVVKRIPIRVTFENNDKRWYDLLTGDEIIIDKKIVPSDFRHLDRIELTRIKKENSVKRAIEILEEHGMLENGKILTCNKK